MVDPDKLIGCTCRGLERVRLSPCVGGLVRTWARDGRTLLWSVDDPALLWAWQGRDLLRRSRFGPAQTYQEALLMEGDGILVVSAPPVTFDQDGTPHVRTATVFLTPASSPEPRALEEFTELLDNALRYVNGVSEVLVVERGGPVRPGTPAFRSDRDLVGNGARGVLDLIGRWEVPPWDLLLSAVSQHTER